MKSKLYIIILFFCFNAVGQGLEFNDAKYKETLQKLPMGQQVLDLPSQIDLSAYAPKPIDQGTSGTCVGMATTYYMRTILEAINLNLTDKK